MKACDIPKFGCLQGIKLVNCASAVGGPVLGCLFAEQGANVIHIEGPRIPDMFHMFQWGWSTDRRNMRDLCLDIFSEEGRDVFKKIISDADVFVESSRGGTWADIGLDESSGMDLSVPYINFGDDFINILTPKMVEYCGQRTYEEIEAELTPHYWLTAPVLNYADILEHPHYKARESVTTYYAPDMEKDYHAVNTVPKFKNNPSQIWRGGPKLGEDNEDILEEAGLTSDEIQTLYDKKLLRKETRPWPECLKPLK